MKLMAWIHIDFITFVINLFPSDMLVLYS